MKNILRSPFVFLAVAAALPACAPGRSLAAQTGTYSAEEQEDAVETSTSTQNGDDSRTTESGGAPAGIQPVREPQSEEPYVPPKPDSLPKSGPTRTPDMLFPARQAPIPTHCGTPTKIPKKAANGIDAIDLDRVAVAKGVAIADWPITSKLSGVSFGKGEVCTPHSKSGHWPQLNFFGDAGTKVEGNMWIFAFIGGRWVGGAGHWLRPGQTCKGTNLNDVGPDIFYNAPPLRNWSPCHGELVGFAVSTPARAGQWGTAERSNVFLIRWP